MAQKVIILSQNDQYHDLETLGTMISDWLADLDDLVVTVSHDSATLQQLSAFDLCLLCMTPGHLKDEDEAALALFVEQGGALFAIHSATVVDAKHESYINLVGGRFIKHSHYHEFQVQIEDKAHPITSGLADFSITDELYVLDRQPEAAHILASAVWEGQVQPMVYVKKQGQGTVLYNALGHDLAAFNHPSFQKLIVQGVGWLLAR